VELKSPIDGVVIAIRGRVNEVLSQRPGEQMVRRAGEVVTAGDPILAVAENEPTEIVAYVSENQLKLLKDQMTVQLRQDAGPGPRSRSRACCGSVRPSS
jgi:multidrug resistance efflux pump